MPFWAHFCMKYMILYDARVKITRARQHLDGGGRKILVPSDGGGRKIPGPSDGGGRKNFDPSFSQIWYPRPPVINDNPLSNCNLIG